MTFEQILLIYLYQHKKVSLQEFGTIELTGNIPDADILRKEKNLPVEGINFKHNAAVITNPEFIDFYAEQKGRIRPMAASDIDMHLLQAKQIVNIGNPYEIPGIGKIIKKDNGSLAILPGYYLIPLPVGTNKPPIIKERAATPMLSRIETDAANAERKAANAVPWKSIGIGVIGLAIVAAIVWAIIAFLGPMLKTEPQPEASVMETIIPPDEDTLTDYNLNATLDSNTAITWKAYIREMKGVQEAYSVLGRFKSYKADAYLETTDSITFKLYIPITASIADTAFKRDSLRKFYARSVTLERMP